MVARDQPKPRHGLKRGGTLEITLLNDLPVPTVLNWHGIDGVPAAEPLAALAPGSRRQTLAIPLRHAGTFMCDLRCSAMARRDRRRRGR
jgi:hypothetical protein